MKILVSICILITLVMFIGCAEKPRPNNSASLSTSSNTGNYHVDDIVVDGCHYIVVQTSRMSNSSGISIIHKANCPNNQWNNEGHR